MNKHVIKAKWILLIWLTTCGISLLYGQSVPYQNSALPLETRVSDLLSRLTVDEKISLMMNDSPAIERLGIPKYDWWNEALHGVARAGMATVFPQAIGLAATFDEKAVNETFSMVSDEARAKHHEALRKGDFRRYTGLTFWTPNINIFRDPRWGRGMETYGEDPYLTTRMGIAVVKGLQGDPAARYDKAHACAKHYAIHSGPEWNRHSFDAKNISQRDLWETYLPAFGALVQEAGVKEVMCAYNRFEGEPCCGSTNLLIKILREKWGYDGIVVSDCGAISDFWVKGKHETQPDQASASANAVLSGTDIECGNNFRSLKKAFQEGKIAESSIDKAVSRLLEARFKLGMFDPDSLVSWASIPMSVVGCEKHNAMALEMARKSIVLLKNSNHTLPLSKNLKKVAVVGPNANDSTMLWGNYNGIPGHTVTILQGIRNKLPGSSIVYEKGCDLVSEKDIDYDAIARKVADADVILFAGGISPRLEGEEMRVNYPGFKGGDRTDIELPLVQRNMLKALKATGKPVILVLCAGSAMAVTWENENLDAILNAWYSGQEGGTAVADVLFGDYNPAGRLPVTFYTSAGQIPDFEDYNMSKGRTYRYFRGKPLYPFGYGLSYSDFSYGKLKCAPVINSGETLPLKVTVKNTGSKDGDEVVQVYIRNLQDPEGPLKSLRAFRRIPTKAGKTTTILFELTPRSFEFYDPATGTMAVRPGRYEIFCGGSSEDKTLQSLIISLKK
jgi:beta-glucosidase